MIYSVELKTAIAKRIFMSWVIVAVIFSVIGVGAGYVLKSHITPKYRSEVRELTTEQVHKGRPLNGEYMTLVHKTEIPIDWDKGAYDFVALNVPMDTDLQEFIYYLCAGYNIDFSLVMAMIEQESGYRTDVVSKTNDYGLMQINKINHDYLKQATGVTDFLDPYENVKAGVYVLKDLFDKYQETDMVLMAYNLGECGAARLWENGIYETNYTKAIREIQQQFNEQIEGGGIDAGKLENH